MQLVSEIPLIGSARPTGGELLLEISRSCFLQDCAVGDYLTGRVDGASVASARLDRPVHTFDEGLLSNFRRVAYVHLSAKSCAPASL